MGLVLRGQLGEQLADASIVAERAFGNESAWEGRILDLREIGLIALWLHSEAQEGLVVPLWEEDVTVQSFAKFLAIAQERARRALGLP